MVDFFPPGLTASVKQNSFLHSSVIISSNISGVLELISSICGVINSHLMNKLSF